jgi:hypothetical protein
VPGVWKNLPNFTKFVAGTTLLKEHPIYLFFLVGYAILYTHRQICRIAMKLSSLHLRVG